MREKQEANKETTGYYGAYAMWRDRSLEDISAKLQEGASWVLRFHSTGSIENQFKFSPKKLNPAGNLFDYAKLTDVSKNEIAKMDADDSSAWFDKVKAITEEIGFTSDMKAYKADPDAFPGTVADVSTFIRQAVTGKTNSPDLYTVMQILGKDRSIARIQAVQWYLPDVLF